MANKDDYIKDINKLKNEAETNLEELLKFAETMLSSASFKKYIKAKTVLRHNTFSAMYQRADAVLAMSRVNQGSAANIIVRSMWETLVEYDFINLEKSNKNVDIRLATESRHQLATWVDVQRLRATHPNANTWNETISDKAIARTISRRKNELIRFKQKYPNVDLNTYKSILSRLKAIDKANLLNNPNHRTLTQFDYRSIYSLLSSDAHSTVIGNIYNSRLEPKVSLEVRLDAPFYETVRATHTAYKFMLRFLQDFNRRQKLKKGFELKEIRTTDKLQDKKYIELQKKYDF